MTEKRRHERINVKLPVILRYDGRLIPATMLNISCGGVFIRAEDSSILSNSNVEITFDIDDQNKDISMRGNVTRVDSKEETSDFGVEFVNLFSQSFKALQEYLGKNHN